MLPNIDNLWQEATKFRELLVNDKETKFIATEDFPIMNCKIASLGFTYHLLTKWPKLIIYGISGVAKDCNKEDTITHYWLEIDEVIIDITADQYNILDDKILNKKIIQKRHFKQVYVDLKNNLFHHKIFSVDYKHIEKHIKGFPEMDEMYLSELQSSYRNLTEHKYCLD